MSDSFALAADQLRALDSDRYFASLALPAGKRKYVQAIWAFAAELAAVRERVSEPAPGEIRLQWWADALEGQEHGAVAQNPVADALLKTLETCALPAGPLVRMIAARRFDLYNDAMDDVGQFEGYAGETVSVLFQYAAMVLADGPAETAADAAGHLGVAQGYAGHLRAFGFNAARGQLFLPLSIFTAHGVREADIYAGRDSDALREALAQCREMALEHLAQADDALTRIPKPLRLAFASIALVEKDLKVKPVDSFAGSAAGLPIGRLWPVLWWALRH